MQVVLPKVLIFCHKPLLPIFYIVPRLFKRFGVPLPQAIEEAKQAVKTFNETGKDSFIRQNMPMRALKIGDIGTLPLEGFRVKQVIDANNVIVELDYLFSTGKYLERAEVYEAEAIDVWLTIQGAGESCTDGSGYKTSDVFFIAGKKQYSTVLNSSRTILHFVRVPDELLR